MKKRYKVVLNVEIEDPEQPFPAGGAYTHKNRIDGMISYIATIANWPGVTTSVTIDKVIDKGEIDA